MAVIRILFHPCRWVKDSNIFSHRCLYSLLLNRTNLSVTGASASGGQILHYVEELARKKLEIQGLRRSRYQLETSLRELQMSTVSLEHKTAEQKSHLHEEIARLERNQSREGANLEYLKNVVLEFSVCPDPSSQSHMFNAIATILQFSPSEVQRVLANQTIW